MVNIVLCATQRCGSTMVIEDMRNTGVLGMPEEWFVPWDPAKPKVNWSKALSDVKRRGTGENGVFAIKVMANQVDKVDACLKGAVDPTTDGMYPRFAAAFKDAIWIKLTRRDTVEQAISRIMAQQTGINHSTRNAEDDHFAGNLSKGYDTSYNDKTIYRYGAVLRHATAVTLENLAWSRFFEQHAITPHEFIYEDVAADADKTHLDVMGELAGINGPVPKAERRMVKLANEKNASWKDRFYRDAAANMFMPRKQKKD